MVAATLSGGAATPTQLRMIFRRCYSDSVSLTPAPGSGCCAGAVPAGPGHRRQRAGPHLRGVVALVLAGCWHVTGGMCSNQCWLLAPASAPCDTPAGLRCKRDVWLASSLAAACLRWSVRCASAVAWQVVAVCCIAPHATPAASRKGSCIASWKACWQLLSLKFE
jgi:hypothetical protein